MLKAQFDVDSLDLSPKIENKEEEDVPPEPWTETESSLMTLQLMV